jgi:hypothetical protein
MSSRSFVLALVAPALLMGALAGCSTWNKKGGTESQSGSSGTMGTAESQSGSSGAMGTARSSSETGAVSGLGTTAQPSASGMMGDQQAMCDMHRKMMAARTQEERQALMDQNMPNMTPDARQQQMQMMQERCK